jgi:hypothetical protein
VTDTVLTAVIHDVTVNSPVGLGDPTFALDTTNDDMIAQKITLTFSDPNTFTAVSDKFGALGAGTMPANPAPAVPFVPNNKWTPEFSITDGVTPLVAADTVVINYKPLVPDQLIGGKVYPDKANEARSPAGSTVTPVWSTPTIISNFGTSIFPPSTEPRTKISGS